MIVITAFCGCGDSDSSNTSDNKSNAMSNTSDAAEVIDSGTFGAQGDNLKWELAKDGTLTISGKGLMNYTSKVPWDSKKTSVNKIIVEEGVECFSVAASDEYLNLKTVSFPSTMKDIETVDHLNYSDYLFSECGLLTEISVAENNSSYKSIDGVLYGNNSTTLIVYPTAKPETEFTIPDSVKEVSPHSFYENKYLKKIDFNSVEKIGKNAFQDCVIEEINIPDSVKTLEEGAFSGCESTKSIVVGGGLGDTMPHNVFRDNTSVETVRIRNGVTAIGEESFYNCKNLKTLYISKSVKTIYANAFKECNNISDLYYGGDENMYNDTNIITINADNTHFNSEEAG